MLIGLCGGQHSSHNRAISAEKERTWTNYIWKGICSGKHAIADYLTQHQGFKALGLGNKKIHEPNNDVRLQTPEIKQDDLLFESVELLLEFVTQRWREHWVTTDIWDGAILDHLIQRPFFLLVSVEAPVSLRWRRFTERFAPNKIRLVCCDWLFIDTP